MAMLYHLDSLLGTTRNASVKYRYLSRCFPLHNIPVEYAWEIAVFVNTPGLLPRHVCALMKWHPDYYAKKIAPLIAGFEVEEAAKANAMSVTEADGLDMLMATAAGGKIRELPIYAWMWIKASGLTAREVAELIGVSVGTVSRWSCGPGFDLLSGKMLPEMRILPRNEGHGLGPR